MNNIHQDYLPRVTSTLGSWFCKAADAFRRKSRRTPKQNKLLAEGQATARHYSSGQFADFKDQRTIAFPGTLGPPCRNSVLNRYVHTQYRLASYRRMHTRTSATGPVVPYS